MYFYNDGEIDIQSTKIAGLSAKEKDNAIGYFGTGLKYAIASILRWGGSIDIYSGLEKYSFISKKIVFREKEFDQIFIVNGDIEEALGFTTEYGKNWKPWQAFRELYANALDENGSVTKETMSPKSNTTVIEVNCQELDDIFYFKDSIILPNNITPIYKSDFFDVYPNESNHIYYKNVRVLDKKSIYQYNSIHPRIILTEDRTIANVSELKNMLSEMLIYCNNKEIIYNVLTVDDINYIEYGLYFFDYMIVNPSKEFVETAEMLWKSNPSKYSKLEGALKKVNSEVLIPKEVKLTNFQQMQLSKAKAFVKRIGLPIHKYDITVRDLGQARLGVYTTGTNKIYLNDCLFKTGTKSIVSVLYEEIIHGETGKQDCTYDMQTFLFDTIITLYEEHVLKEVI
jgi:hypothetical protein